MSALPPKADIADAMRNVGFVPKADILPQINSSMGYVVDPAQIARLKSNDIWRVCQTLRRVARPHDRPHEHQTIFA